jgi:acyl-CoA reductase-like NAD-dependent aldehyde dehydrogenase
MTIDGNAVKTLDTFDVINPATGEVEATSPQCTAEQLDDAMVSAAHAFKGWRSDEDARRRALNDLADAVDDHHDELSRLLMLETGKPKRFADGEVESAGPWLRYFADLEIPRRIVQDDESALIEVAHRPLGVVAAITAWNGPVGLWSWKVAPALRAGNTVVLKPSPFTPLATLLLGAIGAEVLPPGVVNVVTGSDALGAAMVSHSVPRKVTFTGSIRAGRSVNISSASDFKRVTLEMGGNDAAIILDDADIESTVPKVMQYALLNCGQICCIPKRVLVPQNRYTEFAEAFAETAGGVVVGGPDDVASQMGPLSTGPQYARVTELVSDAIAHGAQVATGGRSIDRKGYFFEPTVLTGVAEGVRIVDEEQFGPVVPLLSYRTVDEAVQRANDTDFGLAGSVWSSDPDRASSIAEQLECGTAWINTHGGLPAYVPFSGAKMSGLGIANSIDGLLSFTEQQVVHRSRV